MRIRFACAALALAAFAPSVAYPQPLPDTIASSTLTRAQADELGRRLGVLQGRFAALARETDLRALAVRNIAVEIFGAQPDLDFESYANLVAAGARELQAYVAQARSRTETDPTLAGLRARALEAAEDGRLTEARALYDELIEAAGRLRRASRRAEDLADAADRAEAARLSSALADYRDAARRYAEAAEIAPEGARERWQYRLSQAGALREHGGAFGDNAARADSIRILRDIALPLTPPASADWAQTQMALGDALYLSGYYTGAPELNAAVAAYQSALTIIAPNTDDWADTQQGLGNVYTALGRLGDHTMLERALAAYRNALQVRTREENPAQWAMTQLGIGIALAAFGDADSLLSGEAALNMALEVNTREASPAEWARVQSNLGDIYNRLGELETNSASLALEAYSNAQATYTAQSAPIIGGACN